MEPEYKDKRTVAAFVPYRFSLGGEPEFFMQMRDGNAPVHANMFSLFGGGVEEGESLNEALAREAREELCYDPKQPIYLMRCERSVAVLHVFIEKVGSDFEERVIVQEGEYGRFLRLSDLDSVPISPIARLVMTDIREWLA